MNNYFLASVPQIKIYRTAIKRNNEICDRKCWTKALHESKLASEEGINDKPHPRRKQINGEVPKI